MKNLKIIIVIFLFLLSAGGCSREKEKPKTGPPSAKQPEVRSTEAPPAIEKTTAPAVGDVIDRTTLLAAISAGEDVVDSPPETGYAGPHYGHTPPPFYSIVFSSLGSGVLFQAAKDGGHYVVHNGRAGKSYQYIGPMNMSPDGKRSAFVAHVDGKWLMVVDGREEETYDMVGEPLFSPDGRHIAYEAQTGDKWRIVLDGLKSPECFGYLDKPVFSNDSSKIIYIETTDDETRKRLVVSDLQFKKQIVKEYNAESVVVNEGKTKIAVVIARNGRKQVIETSFAQPGKIKEGATYDNISYPVFGLDGETVSFVASKGGVNVLVLKGREEKLPDGHLISAPVVRFDNKGAGMLIASDKNVFFHQAFYGGTNDKKYEEASFLAYSKDTNLHAYAARTGDKWFVVVNGKEGPAFDRVVTPVFSPDGKLVVYRARKDGKRFVVTADTNGKTIRQHPAYEQVFQPVFTADGKSIAYGVKDGRKLIWKVEKLPL